MKLPNGHRAIIAEEKLVKYVLNRKHDVGGPHAFLLETLLGITPANADVLRNALADAAANGEAWMGKSSPFGTKYEIRFQMTGLRKSYIILSIWMIRTGETDPRLVTAYVE